MATKKFFVKKASNDNLLEMKYYCVARNQQVDVVLELKGSEAMTQSALPQRYVLVIDVSDSMNSKLLDGDERTLLERMKVFAKLFVAHVSSNTFISIVVFSEEARILLPMTKTDKDGKAKATEIINNLNTVGSTNLSAGLITGLETTKSNPQDKSYDCMILFTDGEANCGELNVDNLITMYDVKMKELKKINKVQLVAITIGNYQPRLLTEISSHFSSDAFCWLNIENHIEAEMMIPLFLRTKTALTDVTITLNCLNGVTFVENSASTAGLQNLRSDRKLQYFIYNLPNNITKNIVFKLNIASRQGTGKEILSADVSYFDNALDMQQKTFGLPLDMTSMNRLRTEEEATLDAICENFKTLMKISAFSVSDEGLISSWQNAQLSFAYVMKQLIRQDIISALNQAIDGLDKDIKVTVQHFQDVANKLDEIKHETANVLGSKSSFYEDFLTSVHPFRDVLQSFTTSPGDMTWIRLVAMESSLNMEMPTASGVFSKEAERLFMPFDVEEKLNQYINGLKHGFKETEKPTPKQLKKDIKSRIKHHKTAIKEGRTEEITIRDLVELTNKIKALENLTRKEKEWNSKIVGFKTTLRDIEGSVQRNEIRRF